MTATLANLVRVRSALAEEVLAYLNDLARRSAELPPYYPAHLQTDEAGKTPFDDIRQVVQVVEDRSTFEKWIAEERERLHRAGQEFERLAYKPARSRDEEDEDANNRDRLGRDRPAPPPPVLWDERAGERFQRAVILGDPGFGKTWLLRYEARRLARIAAQELYQQTKLLEDIVLPISVRLSELNSSDDPIEKALVDLAAERAAQAMQKGNASESFRQFVQTKLETDRCVILLDAWDEVPIEMSSEHQSIAYKPHHRQRLGQRLDAFARKFAQPRILMTSRIVGYSQSPIPQAEELELLAFDTPQIESFAQVWFGHDQDSAHQFLAMLHTNHQVRGLARIPLILALMCRAFQEEELSFPTRRVELYDRCLRGLLRDWKVEDKGHDESDLNVSDGYVEAMIEMLSEIGYALFAEGYEQFDELLLRKKLGAWLKGLESWHELAGRTPASLIAQLKRDGILITVSEKTDKNNDRKKTDKRTANQAKTIWIFLHRTFQEYLTAKALATRLSVPANASSTDTWTLVEKKSWDPKWQEVITLLAGQLDDAGPLLRLLSEGKDDYFRHRLALAALCLPQLSQAAQHALSTDVDRITTEAFSYWWERNRKAYSGGDVTPPLTRALPALAQINGRVDHTQITGQLHEVINKHLNDKEQETSLISIILKLSCDESLAVRCVAARMLGEFGPVVATPHVLSCLNRLVHHDLRDGYRSEVIVAAVKSLSRLGMAAATPEIQTRLLELSRHCQNFVYDPAAETLGRWGATLDESTLLSLIKLLRLKPSRPHFDHEEMDRLKSAAATPAVLTRLLELLSAGDRFTQRHAVMVLGRLGAAAATPAVLSRLIAFARIDDWLTRGWSAMALSEIGAAAATPAVLFRLNELSHDSSLIVRELAQCALDEICPVNTERCFRNYHFYSILGDYDNDHAREWAVKTLGLLGAAAAKPNVLTRLLELSRDADEDIRKSVVDALDQLGVAVATPEIISRLFDLSADTSHDVRRGAADALGKIGAGAAMQTVLPRLLELLHDHNDHVQAFASRALGHLGTAAATPEVVSRLLDLLHNAEPEYVVEALGHLGATAAKPEVLARLLNLSRVDHWWLPSCVAITLGRMGAAAATPEVISRLLELSHTKSRKYAVGALCQMEEAAATPDILARLIELSYDDFWVTRRDTAKAIGKNRTIVAIPDMQTRLLEMLFDDRRFVREYAGKAL